MARITFRAPLITGLSVLELLVAINILGITLALGAPSMRRFIARQHIGLESQQLMTSLYYARAMVISMNDRVVLCPSTDLENCSAEPDWQHGLLVFVDSNWNRELDPEERVLLANVGRDNRITITTSRARRRIVYQGTGLAPGSNLTFSICDPNGLAPAKAIIISNTGRPRRSDTRPGGAAIACGS